MAQGYHINVSIQALILTVGWPRLVDPAGLGTSSLRNLSSVNEKTRQQMRETSGLVDSLVAYIHSCIDTGKMEEKVRQLLNDWLCGGCLEQDVSYLYRGVSHRSLLVFTRTKMF